jgi:hypothetical protein
MSAPERRLAHTRTFRVDAYERDDGLWDLEANMADVKTRDIELHSGPLPAGQPLHDMRLTLTVDRRFNIVGARVATLAAPYMGECETFPEAYQQMVGLNLLASFRGALRQRLGGAKGCTHITELAAILPTVAIQSMGGEYFRLPAGEERMPQQLDRCRALRTDGPVVAKFYPRWARAGVRERS